MARLVAQGFKQLEGINYSETFSLVKNFTAVHTHITITIFCTLKIKQFDVSNAFFA